MQSLFLNKNRIDIYDRAITRKIQIADIGDVTSRKSSYSYTINIPRTANNLAVLDMLGVIGNQSRKPFEEVTVDYLVDGFYLIFNGFGIIKSTSGNIQLNIIDGIKSLSDLLTGLKIEDLPLSDLDHIITTQTYIDSYSNTDRYIYGIADYGRGVAVNLKVEKQAPSIFSHTIFRRIFENAGLNLIGEFFDTNNKFLNEVITPAKGYTIEDNAFTSTAKGSADTDTLSGYELSDDIIRIDKKFTLTGAGLVGASIVSGDLKFSVAGTYKINIEVSYNIYKTYLRQLVKLNGSTISIISIPEGNSTLNTSITFVAEVDDIISFHLEGSSYSEPIIIGGEYAVNYSVSSDNDLYLQSGGQLITVSNYIGEMNQLDFIKDVINRYGLILKPVNNATDFEFKRIEVVLNDRATAEDWTEKLASIDQEDYISGYAKTNKANYIYPEGIVIPNNDGEMIVDNFNASAEKTLFSSPFEIPEEAATLAGETTFLIPIWSEDGGSPINEETPLKVMHINRVDTTINAKLFTEVSGITVNEDIPFLNLDYLNLQYLINTFYKAFNSLINNYKKVTAKVFLNVIDIYNLDFFKLKYLKQTGRYYYLNSVQHTPGINSKIELLEILEFPPNLPPSQVGDYSFNMNHSTTRTITLENILTGYEDPELDPAYKIKFISGFNTNVLLKQGGVAITSETEILIDDLDLTAEETVGGVDAYSESWIFAIMDEGSKSYGDETGKLTANVLAYTNNPPVADAGSDQLFQVQLGEEEGPIQALLNGSGSYDDTGEIVSWSFAIISKPIGSTASISQVTTNPLAYFNATGELENIGSYTIRLTVTDEFGATDTDDMIIEIEYI